MAGEAANNQAFWTLSVPDLHVKLRADDERNVIQQIGELIGIVQCIRMYNDPSASKTVKNMKEYAETRKEQLIEDPNKLADIIIIIMAGEAANNQAFWPTNVERPNVDDERNVIQQIGELIGILQCIRISNPLSAGIHQSLREYADTKKKQLTEDPKKLAGIVDKYLEGSRLKLMDASKKEFLNVTYK